MHKWYIVKRNWLETINNSHACLLKHYHGLGGDVWPVCNNTGCGCHDLYNEIEKEREHIEIRRGFCICVCVNLEKAKEYCFSLKKCSGIDAILLEVRLTSGSSDNFVDFGNPEGGFSIIETEIITKNNIPAARSYLGVENGLFINMAAACNFVSSLPKDSSVEELDDYDFFAIKEIDF
jgi:hypothetical protein